MNRKRIFLALMTTMLLLLLAPATTAYAAPVREDEVILGDDLMLREGDRVSGDVVIIGGDLTMLAGSRVEGSATVLRGNAEIHGAVGRDLVVLGGDLSLGAQARVGGDTVALGGDVDRAEGAQIGSIVTGPSIGDVRFWGDLRPIFTSSMFGARPESVFWSLFSTLFGALIMAGLGIVIYHFWPTQTNLVGRTILTAPAPSLGVGCLIYPLAASLAFVILITICLAPFVPVVILLVVAASLLGWVALGRLLGRWLAQWTGWRSATPLAITGLGVLALSILAGIAGSIPCLGPLLVLGAASVGLGAVALSRFGTTRYGIPPAPPPAELEPTDTDSPA